MKKQAKQINYGAALPARLDMSKVIDSALSEPRNLHEIAWAQVNILSEYERALDTIRRAVIEMEKARESPDDKLSQEIIGIDIEDIKKALASIGYAVQIQESKNA